MALADRLQSLGNELENQYQVTYARPSRLIPPKSMEVTVKRPSDSQSVHGAAIRNARIATAAPTIASAA